MYSMRFGYGFEDLGSGFLGFDLLISSLCGTCLGFSGLCLDFPLENVNLEFIFKHSTGTI